MTFARTRDWDRVKYDANGESEGVAYDSESSSTIRYVRPLLDSSLLLGG